MHVSLIFLKVLFLSLPIPIITDTIIIIVMIIIMIIIIADIIIIIIIILLKVLVLYLPAQSLLLLLLLQTLLSLSLSFFLRCSFFPCPSPSLPGTLRRSTRWQFVNDFFILFWPKDCFITVGAYQKLHHELCLQREEAPQIVLWQNAQCINDMRTK